MLGGYDRYIHAEVFDSIADDVSNDSRISQIYAFSFFDKENTGYISQNKIKNSKNNI